MRICVCTIRTVIVAHGEVVQSGGGKALTDGAIAMVEWAARTRARAALLGRVATLAALVGAGALAWKHRGALLA